MPNWRVSGQILAMRRSRYGLHLVLDSKRLEFDSFHSCTRHFPVVRCTDSKLCDQLEAQVHVGDLAHMAGVTAPITRPRSPWLKRDWEMIVMEARVPRLLNAWRRHWMRPLPKSEIDDEP